MKKSILSLVITSAILSGCGGSGGDSSATASLKGVAIDGYITGATAFLDLNFNGKHDAGEPSAITGENGAYDLGLKGSDANCVDYAPVIIDVPVGAVDSDHGDVTEAYQLSFPPAFAAASDEEIRSTTPLTTVVWDSIKRELNAADKAPTCDALKANYGLRDEIKNSVKEQERRVAQRYNVAVDKLYSDFIAEKNAELHKLAQDIVPSLQKSYVETRTLQQNNPKTAYVYVEYFWGLWNKSGENHDDKWYRTEYVNTGDAYTMVTHEVDETLANQVKLIERIERHGKETAAIQYERVTSAHYNEGGKNYDCNINEFYEQKTQVSYGVENRSFKAVDDWKACILMNPVATLNTQAAITKVYSENGEQLLTDSRHDYKKGDVSVFDLSGLIGLGANIESLDGTELDVVNTIPTNFEDESNYGASSWIRIKNEFPQDNEQIMTSHDQDGLWIVKHDLPDGTWTLKCGPEGGLKTVEKREQCPNLSGE